LFVEPFKFEVALSDFYHAIHRLIQDVELADVGVTRCFQPLNIPLYFECLDWLDAQSIFPKFYWKARDAKEEVVALGQLYTFVEPEPAYQILSGEQRIWGGRSFDGGTEKNPHCLSAFFFLPQVELIKRQDHWYLAANIVQEKEKTLSCLRALTSLTCSEKVVETNVLSLTHCPNKQQWDDLIDKALQHIRHSSTKKIVLARQTTLELEKMISGAQLLKISLDNNHNSYHFMLMLDHFHCFLGSTPERLYQRIGHSLKTEALAGTIGRGRNTDEDMKLADWLQNDNKNIQENQYVVDDIIDRLEPCADEMSIDHNIRLVTLRKVQHLQRTIQANLRSNINGAHLLGALQPTAAVSGLPREEAKIFIEKNEPFARGWYAGSVGYISHERAEFCVAIRSALIQGKTVNLYAGAGILPGSEAKHEWIELDKKVSTLLSLITDDFTLGVAS